MRRVEHGLDELQVAADSPSIEQLDERQGRFGLAIFVARESVDAAAEDRKRSPAGVLGRYTSCQIR